MTQSHQLSTLFSCGMLSALMAQTTQPPLTDPQAAAACAACGGSILFLVIAALALIALNIVLLVWVARDAKNRGMDNSVLWMVLVMVTGVLGLVIYLFSRPSGNVVKCGSCPNKRLQASAKCPHCGNA